MSNELEKVAYLVDPHHNLKLKLEWQLCHNVIFTLEPFPSIHIENKK